MRIDEIYQNAKSGTEILFRGILILIQIIARAIAFAVQDMYILYSKLLNFNTLHIFIAICISIIVAAMMISKQHPLSQEID
jgi:hypothetical protein